MEFRMFKRLGRSTRPLIAMILAGCAADPPPFRPRDLQRDELETAGQVPVRERLPLPTTLRSQYLPATGEADEEPVPRPATGPALDSEPTIRMSLQEAVQRAVANSLDVKVQSYSPAIEATRVVEAEARFDPAFFTTAQYENRGDTQTHGTPDFLANLAAREGDSYTLRSGVRQVLPSGGEAELRYQTSRIFSEGTDSTFDPENTAWENELVFQVTQPLLRDFGGDVNRARISIARNNQRISLLDFRESLETTLTEVERAYWQLVQALREVRIQEQLLDDTLNTTDLLFKRRGQDVTRVQLSQANASLETRRAGLIRARARVRDLSDQLKRLMNDPDMPVTSATLILPANDPIEDPIRFSLEDQIATALENRFELGQQQFRIDSSYIALQVARNNLLPQLGLAAQVGATGAGDDFGGAFDDQVELDNNISFALGLQLEVPIGNRAARAIFRRSQYQRQQAMTEYRRLIDVVAFDVKTALREVETTWEEMVATRQARFAAADALYAIRQREEANEPLTPEFVDRKLNLQERFAEAARGEAAAISNYNIAIARLEQAKGTLLRYNNVVMEEQPTAQAMAR
jgi:outer membrane protein TolC